MQVTPRGKCGLAALEVRGSENFFELSVLDGRVLGKQLGLLLLEVVEGAIVVLSQTVLGAEDVGALAGYLDEADFLAARPALIRVRLKGKTLIRLGLKRSEFVSRPNKI